MLEPTHTCFDDALDWLAELLKSAPPRDVGRRYRVCHGILKTPTHKAHFAHAWVLDLEHDEAIEGFIFRGERVWVSRPRAEHEQYLERVDVTTYTLEDVLRLNRQHCTYGPWKPEYQALCGDGCVLDVLP